MDETPTATADEGVVVTAQGRRAGWLARGPRDGRTVVFLHGMPGSRMEQGTIPEAVLNRFGVRLVSIDRPGWGRSDPRAGERTARVADILAACDALGIDTFPLIAFSAGGSYATTLAAVAPDRVERLVLVAAQMPYDDDAAIADLQPDQRSLLPLLRGGRNDAVVAGVEQYRQALLADPHAAMAPTMATLSDPERAWWRRDEIQRLVAEDMREGVGACVDGLLDDLLAWPQPFDVDVSAVACPVRALHGTDDDWEPLANLRRFLPLFRDVELMLFEGRNHLGPLLHPDTVVALAVD